VLLEEKQAEATRLREEATAKTEQVTNLKQQIAAVE
jgi:hypothetical protein